MIKLVSFNVQNLFARPRILHTSDWSQGRSVLDAYSRLTALLEEPVYTDEIKAAIVQQLIAAGLKDSDENRYVVLRQNRTKFVKRTDDGPVITAGGRAEWVGFLELQTDLATEACLQNTARVISELDPDVVAVIEAEDRPALKRFGNDFVAAAPGRCTGFEDVMLIDGNDDRGIDVGIMTRRGSMITEMRSHVSDKRDGKGALFSRDCPEYLIRTPSGNDLLVLVNHLKSKGYGKPTDSNALRRDQATRIADIYTDRYEKIPYVAVVGDLNDIPDSAPLAPLFAAGLADISTHPRFTTDGIPGTWGRAYKGNKLDYVLLSPSLQERATGGGVFRQGVWDDRQTPKWEVFDTIQGPNDAASDHAAIWADLDI